MRYRKLEAAWAATALAVVVAGCHSTGSETAGGASSFGLNYVPRQSEPPLEADAQSPGLARNEPVDLEHEENAPNAKSGTLLTRLLPGREKEPSPRKALPVTARTSANSDDGEF
jgi:hypothetical protein